MEFTYNSAKSEGIEVTLFYVNIGYILIVYREDYTSTTAAKAIRV